MDRKKNLKKPRLGRPKTTGTQPIREVGRCGDKEWAIVEQAAAVEGLPTATWARSVVLREAKKIVGC